jgi:hypothetical protein
VERHDLGTQGSFPACSSVRGNEVRVELLAYYAGTKVGQLSNLTRPRRQAGKPDLRAVLSGRSNISITFSPVKPPWASILIAFMFSSQRTV